MPNQPFSIINRLKNFRYAFNGLKIVFVEEHNARIHAGALFLVIGLGLWLKLRTYEWLAIVLCIGFVITAEIINASIERMANFLTKEQNEHIKVIKDLGSTAVLISALTATVVGLIIVIPYFNHL
jgi:diacylglycerol kinase